VKVYITPCGIGLGHSGRMLSVAEQLKKKNVEIFFSTYGPAYNFVKKNGYKVFDAPDIMWGETDGVVDVGKTVAKAPVTAKKILEKAQVDESIRVKDLTEDQINIIRTVVDEYTVEGELRREVLQNVKRLKDIGCYRGLRHIKRLPAHGQRTKTNSRTVRGNVRQTAGSGRRALTKT